MGRDKTEPKKCVHKFERWVKDGGRSRLAPPFDETGSWVQEKNCVKCGEERK